MENSSAMYAYLPSLVVVVIAAFLYSGTKKLNPFVVGALFVVPLIDAIAMYWIFIVGKSGTVRQLSGAPGAIDYWSLWVTLWPVLTLLSLACAVAALVWVVIAAVKKRFRVWLPVALASVGMHLFAFWTVGSNFPDA